MKTKLLLAGASALALTWASTAHAENIGIGVLEPQAVLHVAGETTNSNDVIFQNLDAYDGTANTENVLLVDEDDGQRVKTVPLTDLLVDESFVNTSFAFDSATNLLSISEGGLTLLADLSTLSDTLSNTDTNTTIASVSYLNGVVTITDSDGNTFPVDISAVDTTVSNSDVAYDPITNLLTIEEEGLTFITDLSDLQDTDTDTVIVDVTYDVAANTLSVLDSGLNQFDVDLTDLQDTFTDLNLGNSNLTQTAGDAVRTYDAGNQELHFANGSFVLGNSTRVDEGESASQAAGRQAGNGYTETPALYTQMIEAINETGLQSTGIAFSNDGTYNSTTDVVSIFTNGQNRLVAHSNGRVQLNDYGQTTANFPGDAVLDRYLTVGVQGNIREVSAPVDTTISNTGASLDGQNVLTITDETGDINVDLSGLAVTLSDTTVSNTAATLDGLTNVLTITDETGDVTVDLSALSDTDTTISNTAATLDGLTNVLTITDETGDVTVDLTALSDTDTTISNTAATLDGLTNVLTITDETGDVTVDLSSLSDALNDTTVSNTAATFDGATNVLTITDETGDVAVDISAVDTDTTDLDWALSGTASTLSTGIGDNIYTNGNVGINTDAPLYPLVVDTAATQNALVVREATEGAQTLGRVGVGTDTPGYSLDVSGDIRATGSIYSGDQFLASNFFQTSDRRLKTEIEGFNRGLEILRQMRLVSYRYNGLGLPTNTERLHYGVIAQELQAIDPELVGSFYSPEDRMDYMTVNVQSMTYVLANALQQLDAENARITAVLLDSEARISRLEESMRLMAARLGVSDQ